MPKHPLYSELLSMCHENSPIANPEGARAAIETASIPNTPEEFRRQMRDKTARYIMPERPAGMEYGKDCFWRFFQQKFVWHNAWFGTPNGKNIAAEFLKKHREIEQKRGGQWPPTPTFRPMVIMPQPRDGKSGANGWTPRTGKE